MNLWLIAAAAAAVTVAGAPSPGPHMHYEIRITGVERKLTDTEKLKLACDLTNGISDRIKAQTKVDSLLNLYLATLRHTTCDKPKSN